MYALDDTRRHLAEGPVWDQDEQALYWVDSLAPAIFRHDWASRTTQRWDPPGTYAGSLAVRQQGGLLLAMDTDICLFGPASGSCDSVASPLAGIPDTRFNDGKVDRQGRFVTGGVNGVAGSDTPPMPVAPMISLDVNQNTTTLLEGFVCFNGPCFSPDGRTLYVNGRGDTFHIEALPYDPDTGEIDEQNGRILITDINPDGTTVDAEGFLWSAQWTDECVLRISPDGHVDHRIDLPGHVVTSTMFGGPEMNTLFVSTLGKPYWPVQADAPDAGAVFVFENLPYRGLAEPRYAG